MKQEHLKPITTPCQSIKIGEVPIEILKLEGEYCLSQTQAEQAIGKQDHSTLRYQLKRVQLWNSNLPNSLKIRKQKPNSKLDQVRIVHPIPLKMAYLYWQLQAQTRPQAKALIEKLGENGWEQFKEIADSAFRDFDRSKTSTFCQSNLGVAE